MGLTTRASTSPIEFTLTAAAGFSLSELGEKVVFQYGTSFTESHFSGIDPPPAVPEPSSLALCLAGLAAVACRRWLKDR